MNENVSAIFEGLNPEQLKAVSKTEGPVLIVAGAGSGKTKVLTCRIANILSKGVPACRVMSLTFTKKAATEMKERISAMVGYRNARGLVMGTFHSVFVRFLREYAESLGYPKEFTIYDTSDSQAMVKTCLKELNLDDKTYKPKNVLSRISQAKNSLVTPAAYVANQGALESDRNAKMPRLCEVYDLYWRKCRQSGVMDFDDILFEMNILLRDNPEALRELQQRFDYIMVDEYQDTNRAQYLILKKLAALHHNLCVVGDDSQSIYAFRGAKIENILNFRKDYPESETFRLEQNYRSTQTIVDAANSVIAHNEGRIPKKCFSMGEKGELIRLIKAYTEQEEAMLIASSIIDGVRYNSAQYQDFAVLYRTNAQSRAIEEALRRRNIPYMIYSGNSFFERAEVKDMMAYLKLVCNPADDESFKRTVNKPARGIGDTTLNALQAAATTKGITMMEAAYISDYAAFGLKAPAMAKLQQFTEMIRRFNARVATDDAYKLTMDIAYESGLWQFYKSDVSVEGQARFANIEELCNSVQSYIEQKENEAYEDALADGTIEAGDDAPDVLVTIPDYLENVALLSAVDVEEDEDSSNKVAMMTVHSSKGLEFPYVFVAGLEENLFPSGGMGTRPNDVEEERRLFYVAVTRAKKSVKLSFAATRMRNGKSESNPVSRFIREIDPQYIENPMLEDNKQARTEAFFGSINNYGGKSLYQKDGNGRMQPSSYGASRFGGSKPQQPTAAPAPAKPVFTKPAPRVPDENFIPSPIMDLRVGQRVEHNRFGCGELLELTKDGSEAKAKIRFDEFGEKVLLLKYAKIRIIA